MKTGVLLMDFYLRQRIGWSSFEKLILVKLMLCFLFTFTNKITMKKCIIVANK